MPDLRTLAELVRAPAALSVPGDILAGAAAAGFPFGARRTAGLAAASVCIYWAGMALNDYADREVDAKERPGRPIPSGRIDPRTALGVATGLTGAGLALSGAIGGRRSLGMTVPLAAGVWAYDLLLKGTPAGALSMAFARGMNVLAGAGTSGWRAAAVPASVTAAHTATLMTLSAREVQGASAVLPSATLAATSAIGTAAALLPARSASVTHQAAGAALAACYVGTFGAAQVSAVARPDAAGLQKAVGAGIMSLIPLQAALASRAGAVRAAVPLLAALPIGRRLGRKVATT
jgi:4-hydroxybenzoate polyprenyltransferase